MQNHARKPPNPNPTSDLSWLVRKNDHTWENGRKYHGHKSEYPFPTDLDRRSTLVPCDHPQVLTTPILAPLRLPLRKGTRILELAAGSGDWLHWLGYDHDGVHKKAIVAGIEPAWMENPHYMGGNPGWLVHQDLDKKWPFGGGREAFYLIRAEGLCGLVGDWEGLYGQVFENLSPGGWIEVREFDLCFKVVEGKEKEMEGRWEAIREWQELMENAAERFGRRINMGRHQKALMEGAGLVEVQETVSKICLWEQADWKGQPFVSAPSEHWLQNGSGQLEKYSFRLFTKTLGWSREETDSFLDRVWQELNQGGLQLYYSYYLVLGKKTGRGVHQRPSA